MGIAQDVAPAIPNDPRGRASTESLDGSAEVGGLVGANQVVRREIRFPRKRVPGGVAETHPQPGVRPHAAQALEHRLGECHFGKQVGAAKKWDRVAPVVSRQKRTPDLGLEDGTVNQGIDQRVP